MDVIIRQARKEEASQIAELFMLAWPVDEILESNGLTCEQLLESITLIAANEETNYSYENTIVAEIDGKVAGAMCAYDGADYPRLKQPIVDALGLGENRKLDNLLRFEDFIKEENQKDRKKPFNKVKSVKDYVNVREDYIHSFIDEHERGVEPEEEE